MYLAVVFLTMFALPVGAIAIEHSLLHSVAPVMALVGKWFVFWAAGVRLALAGLRQYFEPRFTAEEIFGVKGDGPLALVRELGIANFATGTVGILSLLRPDFVAPVAIAATIFSCALPPVSGTRRSLPETPRRQSPWRAISSPSWFSRPIRSLPCRDARNACGLSPRVASGRRDPSKTPQCDSGVAGSPAGSFPPPSPIARMLGADHGPSMSSVKCAAFCDSSPAASV